MVIVDANIVLRYVLDDHADLSPRAAEILEHQSVTLPLEAACEVVYVLQKVYNIGREQIHHYLSELVNENLVHIEKSDVFLKALECYSMTTFDFVDTLLLAYHVVEHHEVLSFDEKLCKQIKRIDTEAEKTAA
ncbi:MAG: PIN domain-containing protein [Desulfatirhabdiaceae bacterium]